MNVGPIHYLVLSILLFGVGLIGVMSRRNLLSVLMSFELMLAATNIAVVGASRLHTGADGALLVLLILTVSAAEVAAGLALVVVAYRYRKSVRTDEWNRLRW